MAARITGGSAIGGVPCLAGAVAGAASSGPASVVSRLPSAGLPVDPGAAIGAAVGVASLLGGIFSSGSSSAPAQQAPAAADTSSAAAPIQPPPEDPTTTALKAADAPFLEAANRDCTNGWTEACWAAQIGLADANVGVECADPRMTTPIPGIPMTPCQMAQQQAQTLRQQAQQWQANQARPTGIDPADIPSVIDYPRNTVQWSDGMTYHPQGDTTSAGAQRLCRAGYSTACPGGVVQFNSPTPAATSAASPGEYDYKAAMQQYQQAMRQYEQAQQAYQNKLRGGPGGNP
jgi:hypothetical protein